MELRRLFPLTLTAIALLAAGCGDDESAGGDSAVNDETPAAGGADDGTPAPSATGSGPGLELAADEQQLKFDKSSLTTKAGAVTITLDNPASIPHNVAIKGGGVDEKGEVVTKATSTVTADLKPGTYTFYCSVAGHEAAGMKGTLKVG